MGFRVQGLLCSYVINNTAMYVSVHSVCLHVCLYLLAALPLIFIQICTAFIELKQKNARVHSFTHSLSLFLCISAKCHSRQRQVWKHWWQKCCCFTPSWIVIEKKTSNNSNGMQNGWVAPHVHNTLKPYSVHIVFGIYRHPTHKKRTQRNSCKLREWSRGGRKRKVYT